MSVDHDQLVYSSRHYDEYRRPDGSTYTVRRSSLELRLMELNEDREAIRTARREHEKNCKITGRKFRSMGE